MKDDKITADDSNSGLGISFNFQLIASALTDQGKVREYNEDAIAFLTAHNFFAIADGMGGFVGGGQTADTVVAIIPTLVKDIQKQLTGNASPGNVRKLFLEKLRELSDDISKNGNNGNTGIFGTTLTAAWFVHDAVVLANLGDSRAYILDSEGLLRQITKDHSIINLLLEQGEITRKEAEKHPARGQLTRYVGMPSPALPEVFIKTVKPGDRILLCSDGLNGMVSDKKIAEIMNTGGLPQEICKMLVDAANDNGGKDNISVVVVEVGINPELLTKSERLDN